MATALQAAAPQDETYTTGALTLDNDAVQAAKEMAFHALEFIAYLEPGGRAPAVEIDTAENALVRTFDNFNDLVRQHLVDTYRDRFGYEAVDRVDLSSFEDKNSATNTLGLEALKTTAADVVAPLRAGETPTKTGIKALEAKTVDLMLGFAREQAVALDHLFSNLVPQLPDTRFAASLEKADSPYVLIDLRDGLLSDKELYALSNRVKDGAIKSLVVLTRPGEDEDFGASYQGVLPRPLQFIKMSEDHMKLKSTDQLNAMAMAIDLGKTSVVGRSEDPKQALLKDIGSYTQAVLPRAPRDEDER